MTHPNSSTSPSQEPPVHFSVSIIIMSCGPTVVRGDIWCASSNRSTHAVVPSFHRFIDDLQLNSRLLWVSIDSRLNQARPDKPIINFISIHLPVPPSTHFYPSTSSSSSSSPSSPCTDAATIQCYHHHHIQYCHTRIVSGGLNKEQ